MPEERDIMKTYKRKLTVSRPVGRPRMDNVVRDIEAIKSVNRKR
jgi:hypothetical protein